MQRWWLGPMAVLALVAGVVLGSAVAQAAPITAITASGAELVLESVTVGAFWASASALAPGTSSGPGCIAPGNTDDFVLSSYTTGCDPQVVDLRGLLGPGWLYTDVNGDGFDLFLFELGGDEQVTIQAILAGGTLGLPVAIWPEHWGHTTFYAAGQDLVGLALRLTDLLDAAGDPLTGASAIEGIQINRDMGGLDPTSMLVFVPEPGSLGLLLLALGGLGLAARYTRG